MPCAERGGAVTDYEEVWRVVSPLQGGHHAWILESIDSAASNEENGNGKGKGERKVFLGRIGGGFLALVEGAGETQVGFGARREEWFDDGKVWKCVYEIGDVGGVPSLAALKVKEEGFGGEDEWREGLEVTVTGRKYVVRAWEKIGPYGP